MEAQVVWKGRGVAREWSVSQVAAAGGEQGGSGRDWRAQEWGQGGPFSLESLFPARTTSQYKSSPVGLCF